MKCENLRSNKPISESLRQRISTLAQENEEIKIAIVGDILLNSKYGESALVITNSRIFCVEESKADSSFFIAFDEVESARVERKYGNAVLFINDQKVMRFSFSIVNLMESVCDQFNAMAAGDSAEEVIGRIEASVDKLICCCPKCGRTLIHPGAECVNCMGKGKLIKKLWAYIAPQKWILLLCLFMSGIATSSQLVPPYISKLLVDDVLPNNDIKQLFILVIGLFILYLLQGVLGSVRGYLVRNAGNRITSRLRSDVYAKAQYLPITFYDKTSTGSIISRISGDTSTINSFMMTITQEAIVQVCTMVGIVVIMISLNWKLALLSLTPVPVVVLLSRYFSKKVRPIYQRIWRKWAKVSNMLTDSLPGIRVIKSFTAEKRTVQKFDGYNETWFDENKKAAALGTLFPHIYTMLMSCGSLAIWAFGGRWAMNNTSGMTVGLLVSFISYASMFYNPVRFFANLSDSYQHALTSCERVLDIIDADPEANFGTRTDIKNFEGKIEFRNVNFSFDKTKKTLENINLTIEPGDIVGIVGTTGSGKSTLINLFMRMYDGYEGEILVDGINIKDIELSHFRSKIGFVQQEPLMFHDTIFNNIAFSNPNASVEDVMNAADIANAHGFVCNMPDAYDTILGERGTGLSGGEKQRLSIARAVMKNPSILVFDEATASVDSETEHLIQGAIEGLISGRTTIMIAHRLSTLRKANRIVVVDKGKIIECGTPEELLSKKGKYYRLIEIQGLIGKTEEEGK